MLLTKRDWCIKVLDKWIDEKRTGNLQFNFFKGGVSTVNKNETIKYEDEVMK